MSERLSQPMLQSRSSPGGFPVDAARAGDVGELVAADDGPLVRLAVPLGEHAARHGRVFERRGARDRRCSHRRSGLARSKNLCRGSRAGSALRPVSALLIRPQFRDRERLHVHLVNAFLHRGEDDFVRRVGQMPRQAGGATEHFVVGNHADVAVRADGIRPDEKLLRLAMNHAVRRRAADAFGTDDLLQRRA